MLATAIFDDEGVGIGDKNVILLVIADDLIEAVFGAKPDDLQSSRPHDTCDPNKLQMKHHLLAKVIHHVL